MNPTPDHAPLTDDEREVYERRIATLEKLVMSLAEKLLTVAEHLGRLAEKKELRK